MERIRRGPDEITPGRARPAAGPGRRPQTLNEEILDLQATAGNRSVASTIGVASVQRDPAQPVAAAAKNDGGVLTFDSGEVIPIKTATWSMRRNVKQDPTGGARDPVLVPTNVQVGDLELSRSRDAMSEGIATDFQKAIADGGTAEGDHATLKLNQPSTDGGLPPVTLDLWKVGIKGLSVTKGDQPAERLTLYADRMQVAGSAKEETSRATPAAVAHLTLEGRKATPVFHLELTGGKSPSSRAHKPDGGTDNSTREPPEPLRVTVVIPAGATFTELAKSMGGDFRYDAILALERGGSTMDLRGILASEISGSSWGPAVATVVFYAESFSERR